MSVSEMHKVKSTKLKDALVMKPKEFSLNFGPDKEYDKFQSTLSPAR